MWQRLQPDFTSTWPLPDAQQSQVCISHLTTCDWCICKALTEKFHLNLLPCRQHMATNHPKLLILGNCLESGCESRHVYLSFICIHNQKMVIDNVHTVFTMCCMAMSLTWRLWSPVVISYFKNVCIVQLLCISAMLLDTFTCVTVVSWLARVKHIHHIYSVPVLMTSSDIIWCCLLAVMWWFMICQFADVWL